MRAERLDLARVDPRHPLIFLSDFGPDRYAGGGIGGSAQMRFATIMSLAVMAASSAQAAEKSISVSQAFSLSDSILLRQDVIYSPDYISGSGVDGFTNYSGTQSRQLLSSLAFGAFDSALGTLTRATLSFNSTAVADMGVSQVTSDPAEGSLLFVNPGFSAVITGQGVAKGHSDTGEVLRCLVNTVQPQCLSILLDRSGQVDFVYDLDLAKASNGYSFDLTHQVSLEWFSTTIGRPIATALISGDWTGQASLTYTYVERAAVPEPATWAMMIMGFGAAGATVRRQRRVALA